MSFTKYSEYKESGIDWLGPVPITWLIQRSDAVLKSTRRQIDPSQFAKEDVFHYSIPSVQEIGTGRIEDGSEIASAKQLIDKKVVLVSKLNPRKATTCIAEPKGRLTLCSTEFVSLEPKNLSIEYLAYLVQGEGFRQSLESKVMSVTNSHQRAEPSDIYRFWMALPSQLEQQKISTFLDRETAKIDALVAEQESLIEILKEKRQGVIRQAITKGLELNVPMKDSGVEWLGLIPSHWSSSRFKWQIERNDGGVWGDDPDGEEDTIVLRSTEQTVDGHWRMDNPSARKLSRSERAAALLEEGDLVVTKSSGSSLHIGKTTIVTTEIAAAGCCYSNFMQRVRMRASFLPELAWYVMNNELARLQFDLASNSTTGLANLNATMIGAIVLAIPPLDEQGRIVSFLRSECQRIDGLISEVDLAITLLAERRSSLVSAAVTGQIDIRKLEVA
jgi:type I restriction enzyme S subunit